MPAQDRVNFLIQIPNPPVGQAKNELSKLLEQLMEARVKLRGIVGFPDGDQMKIFCTPEDAEKFRTFLKSAGLNAQEGAVTDNNMDGAMAVLDKVAVSGFDLQAFAAFAISRKAGGVVWYV